MSFETAVANDTGPWRETLTGAFEILLGGPLSAHDPDAVYATYFGGGLISEIGFNRDTAWLDPAALTGAAPVVWDYPPFDQGEPPLQFDAAGSVFELSQDGLPADVAADLTRACFAPSLVRGADLAPVLARHGFDLWEEGQSQVEFAVVRLSPHVAGSS